MLYLKSFMFPSENDEYKFILDEKRTCYDSFYPFMILSKNQFERIDFEPITILYGGNGSGKSTALNIIGEKLGVKRDSVYNKTSFYEDYVSLCYAEIEDEIPYKSRIITSDDVFDYMLNIRSLNDGIDKRREEIFKEYIDIKFSSFQMKSLEDYEKLKKNNYVKSTTQSKFVRNNLRDNIRTYSNGESAFKYFLEKIDEGGLYILDEPENSLSPKRQIELTKLIQDYARFLNCQFIISTHSPFLLSLKDAKIYDLDEDPVDVKRWTELENVQTYYNFFRDKEDEFL